LPETVTELAYIKQHTRAPLRYTQLDNDNATKVAVLEAMEHHDWVHLACHAHQNMKDPTSSGFFLHDGTLSLATIGQKAFKHKGLAFLSACQTATGAKVLADEAVHLASGMLMAGYPSVIATMWSIMDADAPLIADKVYGELLKDGHMNYKDAAKALHNAVSHLRSKVGEKAFSRWVPYIHIGV
jgi:CHAT domain-containing protein